MTKEAVGAFVGLFAAAFACTVGHPIWDFNELRDLARDCKECDDKMAKLIREQRELEDHIRDFS